jgi:hypothetical protein
MATYEEATERIDQLVESWDDTQGEIARKFVKIPNTPDMAPELNHLRDQYGPKLKEVMEQIVAVSVDLGIHYNTIQRELQKRL